jgi:hypothetical protein
MGYELKEHSPTPPEPSFQELRCNQPAVSALRQTQQDIICCRIFRVPQPRSRGRPMALPKKPLPHIPAREGLLM